MDGQTVLTKSFGNDFHDTLGITMIAEPNRKIIRKADEEGIALKAWLHVFLEP